MQTCLIRSFTDIQSEYYCVPFLFPRESRLRKVEVHISGRGGQSALRFARLRMEKRHNYVRKVAEVATTLFITNDKPNIAGIILAGSADFKTELSQSDMFDPVGFHRIINKGCILLYYVLVICSPTRLGCLDKINIVLHSVRLYESFSVLFTLLNNKDKIV